MPLLYVILALVAVALLASLINRYITLPRNATVILNIVLALIVVGIALWLINTYVPMAGSIKAILNIVVVVATCVGVLQAVGLWGDVVRIWNNLVAGVRHSAATSSAPTPDKPRSTGI
ncbi:MAG: Thivi_2564 family membrane protein [Bryobacteraceae bacterium]|jgi:predicted membrane protein